jgi:aristolochene synthase
MYTWITSILYGRNSTQLTTGNEPPQSIFTPICQPKESVVSKEVNGFYLQHWNFPNEKAKSKFVAAGFSRVTCLYFPKALDSRIAYACSLLTILFLIDGRPLAHSRENRS